MKNGILGGVPLTLHDGFEGGRRGGSIGIAGRREFAQLSVVAERIQVFTRSTAVAGTELRRTCFMCKFGASELLHYFYINLFGAVIRASTD